MGTIRALLWTVSFGALAAVAMDSTFIAKASEKQETTEPKFRFSPPPRAQHLGHVAKSSYQSAWGGLAEDSAEKIATLTMAENKSNESEDTYSVQQWLILYKKLENNLGNPKYSEIHDKMLDDVSRKRKMRVQNQLTAGELHRLFRKLFNSLTLPQLIELRYAGPEDLQKKFDMLFIPALKDHAYSSLQ